MTSVSPKTKLQSWIHAFRLRTLPLAFSSIITGSSLAFATCHYMGKQFSVLVFGLCLLTTLLLQILSNLANDYGDSASGADNEARIGPRRAVHAGLLTVAEIKRGIIICAVLCLISGIGLIFTGTQGLNIGYGFFFLALGVGAIFSAIGYTVGKNAYGYRGLGDLFVLLFFGFAGVCGSYYLLAHLPNYTVLLPAFTIGAFATGVLNLNNMRDRESDQKAGKITMVVRMGLARAKNYHMALILLGFLASLIYVALNFHSLIQLTFVLTAPLFRKHLATVRKITDPVEFDPLLKQLAISTFIFSILFAIGMIVGAYL